MRQVAHELAPYPHWWLAYSGGRDSYSLATLLAELDCSKLTLVHVHHGWSPLADAWWTQAQAHAQRLGCGFEGVKLDPMPASEAAARSARYQALTPFVESGHALITAHHFLDHLETLTMRVTQGRPPRGIPACRPIGQGQLVRPLRDVWPSAFRVGGHEDPANKNPRYRRVAVRLKAEHLSEFWPSLWRLGQVWQDLERHIRLPARLPVEGLSVEAIKLWLWQHSNLPAPPNQRLLNLLGQLPAQSDRQPQIEWDALGARWILGAYRGELWVDLVEISSSQLSGQPIKPAGQLHALGVPPWLRKHVREWPDGSWRWFRGRLDRRGKVSLESTRLRG